MTLRVFAQNPFDLSRIVGAGTTHFGVDVEVLAAPTSSEARLRVSQGGLYSGEFDVRVRPVSEVDVADAERAEHAGRTPGMASLARRCTSVWDVTGGSEPSLDDPATLGLCSVLTTVALGPALPADLSTLLGIRSSQERLKQRLSRGS